jgi:hypothetical protein
LPEISAPSVEVVLVASVSVDTSVALPPIPEVALSTLAHEPTTTTAAAAAETTAVTVTAETKSEAVASVSFAVDPTDAQASEPALEQVVATQPTASTYDAVVDDIPDSVFDSPLAVVTEQSRDEPPPISQETPAVPSSSARGSEQDTAIEEQIAAEDVDDWFAAPQPVVTQTNKAYVHDKR